MSLNVRGEFFCLDMINPRELIRLLRPKQWVKNTFVLAPLVFSGQFLNVDAIKHAIVAAILFCIASSIVYIINDINDIKKDRAHPKKKYTRPLAAGAVSKNQACVLIIFLATFLFAGWIYQSSVMWVIVGYVLLNIAYTFFLKNQAVIDIFVIALGFVFRVYAGAVALSVPLSEWMFISTLCLALYLAAIKRRQELEQVGTDGRAVLEKYSMSLIDKYAEMSAMGALVFYSMFVMSARPELIVTVPVVLFGLFRYWYIVEKLKGGESPTDALFSDWPLLATIFVWVVACIVGLWPKIS
ncbi:decaprenyl-phosphate phosphoribosyltransferase [Comamonas sediminis]|uniref:decaprenyl-phosphate phosphoribosyltransferase n=1 Tax=Comamonas sediminis TaxID=1783360 RepID=UPI003D2DDB4C